MIDVRCWRCDGKLFTNENAVGTVVIKCDRCKALNRVTMPLDRSVLAAQS